MDARQPEDMKDAHQASALPSHDDNARAEAKWNPSQRKVVTCPEPPSRQSEMFRPSEAGIAAQKVFDLPEMLEEILSYLDPSDVLHAMGTRQSWKETIENSTSLKRLLGLAAGGQFFYSPFLGPTIRSTPVLMFEGNITPRPLKEGSHVTSSHVGPRRSLLFPYGDKRYHGVRFELSHHVNNPRHWLQNRGTRVRDMAICNPPLKRITAELECWDCSEYEVGEDEGAYYGKFQSICASSDRGLTIGDISDAFASLVKTEHLECATRGFFGHGSVDVEDDDPIVKAWIRAREHKMWLEEYASDASGSEMLEEKAQEEDEGGEHLSDHTSEQNTESVVSDDEEYDEEAVALGDEGRDAWEEEHDKLNTSLLRAVRTAQHDCDGMRQITGNAPRDLSDLEFAELKQLIESNYGDVELKRRVA